MGNIGEPMTYPTVPPVGTTGTSYASTINEFLGEVKQRLEDPVPLSSINIETLDMANSPVQNVEYLSFSESAELPEEPAGSIWFYDGEFYMVTSTGAVQITDGLTLNIAGVGGITGDYGGANPAQLRFVDADQEYYFYDNYGTGAWGRAWARTFDVAGGATSANRVRLAYAGTVDQTITLPAVAADAGAQSLITTDGTGALAFATAQANLYFTEDQTATIPATHWFQPAATHTPAHNMWVVAAGATYIWAPIQLPVGALVTAIRVKAQKNTSGSDTIGATTIRSLNGTDSAPTGTVSLSNADNAPGDVTLDSGAMEMPIEATYAYHIRLEPSGSVTPASDRFYLIEYDWNFPAP